MMSALTFVVGAISLVVGAWFGSRFTQWALERREWNGGKCPCGIKWQHIGKFGQSHYWSARCSLYHNCRTTFRAIDNRALEKTQ